MKCDIEIELFDPDIYISKMHTHRLTDVHRFRHNHRLRITYDHTENVIIFGTGFILIRTLSNSLWTNENR